MRPDRSPAHCSAETRPGARDRPAGAGAAADEQPPPRALGLLRRDGRRSGADGPGDRDRRPERGDRLGELAELGLRRAIRVGTCAAPGPRPPARRRRRRRLRDRPRRDQRGARRRQPESSSNPTPGSWKRSARRSPASRSRSSAAICPSGGSRIHLRTRRDRGSATCRPRALLLACRERSIAAAAVLAVGDLGGAAARRRAARGAADPARRSRRRERWKVLTSARGLGGGFGLLGGRRGLRKIAANGIE